MACAECECGRSLWWRAFVSGLRGPECQKKATEREQAGDTICTDSESQVCFDGANDLVLQ